MKQLLIAFLICIGPLSYGQKVIDLPAAGTLTGAELISISVGGTATKKTTLSAVAGLSNAAIARAQDSANQARAAVRAAAALIDTIYNRNPVKIVYRKSGTDSVFSVRLNGDTVFAHTGAALTIDATPTNGSTNPVQSDGVFDALAGKNATLISGTNIKTVGGVSVLGSGDIPISGGGGSLQDAIDNGPSAVNTSGTIIIDDNGSAENALILKSTNMGGDWIEFRNDVGNGQIYFRTDAGTLPNGNTQITRDIVGATYLELRSAGAFTTKTTFSRTPSATSYNIAAPNATGTILLHDNTATITNKTINGASNTLTVRAASDITGQLPIANGGTGTASPGIIAGTGISVSGSFPTQTVNNTAVLATTDNNLSISGTTLSTKKTVTTLTYGTTLTWNIATSYNAKVTLTGNVTTFTISNAQAGDYGTIEVIQDGTGSRTMVLPASSKVIGGGSGAITLSTAASSIDLLTFFYDGTNYYWNYGKNYN